MIKNKDAQSNGRILASNILSAKEEEGRVAEIIQVLLSYAADTYNQVNRPFGVTSVETALEILFKELEPEQVVL